MKIHIQLNYGLDEREYRRKYEAGLVPDAAPYGFDHARELEKEITFSQDRKKSPIWNFCRRAIKRLTGFDLLHTYDNRRLIADADVVWTMIESDYLAVAALALFSRRGRPKIIGNNVWLFENIERMGAIRRYILATLISRVSILTVHSKAYLPIAMKFFPKSTIRLMLFGISDKAFARVSAQGRPREGGKLRIVSAGNDRARDWMCLLDAFGNDARFDLVVVSDQVPDSKLAIYSNLRLPRRPSLQEFRKLYEWADYVVVPMVANKYSGITVALEALSLGCCVIASRTGGIPTYFDEDEVIYCDVGDATAMRNAVLSCGEEQRARTTKKAHERFERSGYTTKRMISRYYDLSQSL